MREIDAIRQRASARLARLGSRLRRGVQSKACAGGGPAQSRRQRASTRVAVGLSDLEYRQVIQAAEMTRIHNGLMPAVEVQLSDGLRRIPDHDGWDLAVGNPPHFNSVNRIGWIRTNDLDCALHEHFYASIKPHMKHGRHVVLVKNRNGSNC